MCKTKVKLNFQLEKWVKTKAAEGNQNKLEHIMFEVEDIPKR